MKKLFVLFLFTVTFSSCEKDDICSDETTPRLIIEFFSISEPDSKLNVSNLKVTGIGKDEPLDTFSAKSKIELPLNRNEDVTAYSLVLNSTNEDLANEDILEFNYTRNEVFVSRACGFKTVFMLNNFESVIHTDSQTPDQKWIKNIVIETKNISTENETHIKIYF